LDKHFKYTNKISGVESNIMVIQTTLPEIQITFWNQSRSGLSSDITLPLPASSVNYKTRKIK
jgi:hypothetical protein